MINKKFLMKKSMIIAAGLSCLIALIFNCIAMATDYWIISQGCNADEPAKCNKDIATQTKEMNVNYGLFRGSKEIATLFSPVRYQLSVYCDAGEGVCLLSCGANRTEQKKEFQYLKYDSAPFTCATLSKSLFQLPSYGNVHGNEEFMNYHLWVSTVVFISFTIAFQGIAIAACILNIATIPVETWLGPIGIYLANGGAAFWNFVTMCCWGDLFNRNIYYALAIQETILKSWSSTSTSLGYSYWMIFISMIFNIISCLFVRFRHLVNDSSDNNGHQDNNISPNGAGFLY